MLSTITQPNREMGRSGVQLVVEALAGGKPLDAAMSKTFPHEFRDGESCARYWKAAL
jgi:DNA-binding LacI/PurR family transcriptional regulator